MKKIRSLDKELFVIYKIYNPVINFSLMQYTHKFSLRAWVSS